MYIPHTNTRHYKQNKLCIQNARVDFKLFYIQLAAVAAYNLALPKYIQ